MTLRGRFFWKILLGHVALAVIVLSVGLFLLVRALERLDDERATAEQSQLSVRLAALVSGRLDETHQSELTHLAQSLGTSARQGTRITLILPDGTVLADSEADPQRMESHADRPEVLDALEQGTGQSTRWSDTVARRLRYAARRIGSAAEPEGIVRVAVAVDRLGRVPATLRRIAWRLVLLSALATTALAIGLAALWSDRIYRLTHAAQRLARGSLGDPIQTSGRDEVDLLARSLNRVRDRFSRQLEALKDQRATLESILAQLTEGILVVSDEGRVAMINDAARKMLGVEVKKQQADALGASDDMTIERCIPHHDLLRLLSEPTSAQNESLNKPVEIRLDLPGSAEDRTVLASVVSLASPEPSSHAGALLSRTGTPSTPRGRLLVLTDITELTRTIKMKTEFVAHASHELRTPLTAMRGAVETLMQMDLVQGDRDAPRFLSILVRHGQRLESLAADLLSLARVEAGARRFETVPIAVSVLRSELGVRWNDVIARKQLHFSFEAPPELHSLNANAYLLNLALDNLIENAAKFTAAKGHITVGIEQRDQDVAISVRDTGCGIPPEEQSRVFERFYQANQTRAAATTGGTARGTGLGLSIVRHAVRAMGGTVSLESTLGVGTTVTIGLPQEPR